MTLYMFTIKTTSIVFIFKKWLVPYKNHNAQKALKKSIQKRNVFG